jgi:methionine aminotransferase
MQPITSKLPDVGTSIFSVMSKMAQEHNAINLSQGFPDFEVSAKLISLVDGYMQKGMNQYAPMPGVFALREAIARMTSDLHAVNIDPENEVTVTSGATEAIFDIITATVHQRDEVILFDPAYDCYDPAIRLSGGTPIHLKLKQPDFSIDWQEVKSVITSKTKLIIINTPHNPSGSVLSADDLQQLEGLVRDTNILILSDEVYEHIIYDDLPHESVLRYPALKERSAAVYSFGKTYHATGWKMGYVIAPDWWTSEIRKMHQFVTFGTSTPVQYALADYIGDSENYNYVPKFYQQKRDHFLKLIAGSRLKPVPCRGTYFQLLSYQGLYELGDRQMAEYLTKEKGLATIPISVFYGDQQDDQLLRVCFAKGEDTLEKAAEILCKI